MQKADLIRLHHMRDAAREAFLFAEGKNKNDLKNERMLTLSIIKAIEMIGEAAPLPSLLVMIREEKSMMQTLPKVKCVTRQHVTKESQ